jgi:hypothetical protein
LSNFDHLFNICLSDEQKMAIKEVEVFLNSTRQIFILKGYAGTGKTTLLKGIGAWLKGTNRYAHTMAPTGRAAKIIKDRTGLQATTIHKVIYNLKKLETINTEEEDGKKSYKFFFSLNSNEFDPNTVFLVDESSMISNQFSEGEFFRFGTGCLLNDLLSFVDLTSSKNHKIIFIGDPAQLPPVNDSVSLALEKSFFAQRKFSTEEFELRTVVRQEKESGILKNAELYRERIFSTFNNSNKIETGYDDITVLPSQDLVDKYLESTQEIEAGERAIIAFSNKTVHDYNKLVREKLFSGREHVITGDRLLVTHNNYRYETELFNGDIVTVLSASDTTSLQSAPVIVEGKSQTINLYFRDVAIQVPGFPDPVNCKIIENHLNSEHRDLSSAELKALYINFVMRFRDLTNGKYDDKSDEFKRAISTDPFFNALRVKYGYAITCHKAQGGEWKDVFVDFYGRIGFSNDHLRWCYTAITRAEKHLYITDPPALEPHTGIQVSAIQRLNPNNLPSNMFVFGKVPGTPYHDESTHPVKRIKFFELLEKLKGSGVEISNVITSGYQEQYYFEVDGRIIRINATHNSAGVFTYVETADKSDQAIYLTKLLQQRRDCSKDFKYVPTQPLLIYLSQFVEAVANESDLQTINVDDSTQGNYYITWFFKTEADCAFIQFYFNKKGKITSAIPKSTLGEQDTLLKAFLDKLKNLYIQWE